MPNFEVHWDTDSQADFSECSDQKNDERRSNQITLWLIKRLHVQKRRQPDDVRGFDVLGVLVGS
jgi:hypothetical protein